MEIGEDDLGLNTSKYVKMADDDEADLILSNLSIEDWYRSGLVV